MHINKETATGNTYSVVYTISQRTFEEAGMKGRVVNVEIQIAHWEQSVAHC